ncbi:hypothetical protein GSI_06103 [Ganoderma sinense ZZ0214-1]|uniref:Uncharacterized protein n=1 Tax=Ganoderma sinense ZZ0214-1 TaxID=1077348 RepID=A0A2G8SCD8_9APHY|nr:hypothetical protein GSI_06103 [Ganoderma sinense ZZ0214-1]
MLIFTSIQPPPPEQIAFLYPLGSQGTWNPSPDLFALFQHWVAGEHLEEPNRTALERVEAAFFIAVKQMDARGGNFDKSLVPDVPLEADTRPIVRISVNDLESISPCHATYGILSSLSRDPTSCKSINHQTQDFYGGREHVGRLRLGPSTSSATCRTLSR